MGIGIKARGSRVARRPTLVEMETLFTTAAASRPPRVTMAAFSKAKLGRLFAAVPTRQHGPDVLWAPDPSGPAGHVAGVADDGETMDGLIAATATREPDLAVVNLERGRPDGARAGHGRDRRRAPARGRGGRQAHRRPQSRPDAGIARSSSSRRTTASTTSRRRPSVRRRSSSSARGSPAEGIEGVHVRVGRRASRTCMPDETPDRRRAARVGRGGRVA
jgi:hypothetical protein